MFKNVASQQIVLLAIDTATNTPKTGDAANITAYLSKDYGTVTVLGDTTATEMDATNAPGLYRFDVTQTESNCDVAVFSAKSSTSGIRIVPVTVFMRPANMTAMSIDSSGRLDMAKLAGQTITAGAGVTFPSSIASPTNITAGTITTATNLTNNNDKTGYTLLTSPPTASAIATAVWQDTTPGDFTVASSIGKSLYTSGNAPGAASGIALVGSNMGTITGGTITTYTGNTPQTGDAFARIGATGSGLTSLAPASTALSTATWTGTRAGYIDNLSAGAVMLASSYSAPPSAAAISTQVASDLATAHGAGTWTTATGFSTLDAAGVRNAVGLASANLDTQLDALPTNSELTAATSTLASQSSVNTLTAYVDTEVAAILDAVATTGVVLSAAQMNKIADHVLRRQMANVEASSSGDTLSLSSQYGAIQQIQESAVVGTTLTVNKTDGTTALGTKTVATASGADAITGIS